MKQESLLFSFRVDPFWDYGRDFHMAKYVDNRLYISKYVDFMLDNSGLFLVVYQIYEFWKIFVLIPRG